MQVSTTLTLLVGPALQIISGSLPNAVQGVAYSFQLNASGGIAPYTWAATGLPSGLTCSASGLISGTPSASGSFNVSITCTDAA